jgi:hypothetical protein
VSVPTFASIPLARAPCRVANSMTSRDWSSGGSSFSPLIERSFKSARWSVNTERICVNMSAAMVVSTSLDRVGRMPASSAFVIGTRAAW